MHKCAKEIINKFILCVLVISIAFGFVAQVNASSLNDLLNKQAELKKQADQNQKLLEQKKKEASNLQDIISDLDDDIGSTQNSINGTQSQIQVTDEIISQLNDQVDDAQKNLDDLEAKLSSAYVSLYELSQTNTLELVMSSDSITEVASHTQYIQSIQEELQSSITQFNNLKDQLISKKTERESQRTDLQKMKDSLVSSKNALNSQKSQKDYLLKVTEGQQAKYQAIVQKLAAQQENISKEIYEKRKQLSGGEQVIGGTGGYPWASESNPYAIDPWFFYKRQCVSYAAWKFQAHYGKTFYNTRPGQGSAWNWPALARDQGYNTSSTPKVNSVVSWGTSSVMPYGHVAWVEAVNNNGTIDVSEYNWGYARSYSERKGVNPYRYGTPTYIYP